MRILIRNGMLHTMTDAGTFAGDVLLENGRIARMAPKLNELEQTMTHIIDAQGLHVCPGLIDAHVHLIRAADRIETDIRAMSKSALLSGVTSLALWQDSGTECLLLHGWERTTGRGILHINAEGMREDPLRRVMEDAAERGLTAGCEIHSERVLEQVLRLKEETGCAVILTHLTGCGEQEDAIADSGCPVILGACCLRGRGSAYELACRLQGRGVTVAITVDYPASRLHYLSFTAGLCQRVGMSTDEALRTITLDAAKVLGIEKETGSLETGKQADLVLFDGKPLRFATSRVLTICGGELV